MRDRQILLTLLGLILLSAAGGCGQAEFDRRLSGAVDDLQYRARFGVLDPSPQAWLDLPLQMRLPANFSKPVVTGGAKKLTIRPHLNAIVVKEDELPQPTFVKLPGAIITYQLIAPNSGSGSQAAYSIHVAAASVGLAADETTLDKLRDDIKLACPDDSGIQWEDVVLETIDHEELRMRHLRAKGTGEISFYGYGGDAGLFKGPMILDLYTANFNGYRVFVGWWVPEHLQANIKLDELAKLSTSTLQQASR